MTARVRRRRVGERRTKNAAKLKRTLGNGMVLILDGIFSLRLIKCLKQTKQRLLLTCEPDHLI